MRFTFDDLKDILSEINQKLAEKGKDEYSLKASPRNNYYGLDVYKGTRCIRCVTTSKTPKGLEGEAYKWAFDYLTR